MTISVNSAAGAKGNEANFVTDSNGNVTGLEAPNGSIVRTFAQVDGSAVAVATQSTSEVILGQVQIPAGLIGANGVLRYTFKFSHSSGSNSKTIRVRFGTAGTTSDSLVLDGATTSNIAGVFWGEIANRNSASSQICGPNNSLSVGGTTVALRTASIDTTSATYVSFGALNTSGADTFTLESYFVEVLSRS